MPAEINDRRFPYAGLGRVRRSPGSTCLSGDHRDLIVEPAHKKTPYFAACAPAAS
jgi:hypothetical protein